MESTRNEVTRLMTSGRVRQSESDKMVQDGNPPVFSRVYSNPSGDFFPDSQDSGVRLMATIGSTDGSWVVRFRVRCKQGRTGMRQDAWMLEMRVSAPVSASSFLGGSTALASGVLAD